MLLKILELRYFLSVSCVSAIRYVFFLPCNISVAFSSVYSTPYLGVLVKFFQIFSFDVIGFCGELLISTSVWGPTVVPSHIILPSTQNENKFKKDENKN